MYRSLNVDSLGITGRQSELIELALSNRFKGLEIDIEVFARSVETKGPEYATRCIESAKKAVGLNIGVWNLPVRWSADEEAIKAQVTKIPALANAARIIDASLCVTVIEPGSESLPLKDSFDFYAQKLNEIGDLLAPHGVSLAIGFKAAAKAREGLEFEFVHQAETMLTLLSMLPGDNVGLHLDTWNWHLGGGTIDQVLGLGVQKLKSVSVADVPAGATADSIELNQRLLPDPEGTFPTVELLNKLHEAGFEGPVSVTPHVSQYKGITRDKLVAKVAGALRSVWPGADLLEEAELEAEDNAAEQPAKEETAENAGDKEKGEAKEGEEAKTEAKAEAKA